MKKLSIEEILNIPQLSFFIPPQNCAFFVKRNKDFEVVANIANTDAVDTQMNLSNELYPKYQSGDPHIDNIVTKIQAKALNESYIRQSDRIDVDKLMLYLSGMCNLFLSVIDKAEKGKNTGVSEFCYSNGDIVNITNNTVNIKTEEELEPSVAELKNNLAEGILIANEYFSNNKYKDFSVSGKYMHTGTHQRTEKITFSAKDLQDVVKNGTILKYLNKANIKKALDERKITRSSVSKALKNGMIDKDRAIELYLEGIITKEELLHDAFKKSDFRAVVMDEKTSIKTKLLLYSTDKISIDVLEKSFEKHQEECLELSKELEAINKYYHGNIKKITELLTHNVFDYSNSKDFLALLQEKGGITEEENLYLSKLMSDFKTNQLLNGTKNQELVRTGENIVSFVYKPGITIDPDLREKYLINIGAVKKLKIKGQPLLKDNESSDEKKNSLDGYEIFIVPDKKVAILEKLYEVTRDEQGNVVYKKDAEGKLIPAVNNATYIVPIEMAKEFAEKKNKQELIKSPYVERANHSLAWSTNIESKIQKIVPEVEFDEKNSKIWGEKIKNNYLKNKKKREKDFLE